MRNLGRLTGEDINATLRRFKDSSALTLQELKEVLQTMQTRIVGDDVREWIESELLRALAMPEAWQHLGHVSLLASTAKLSIRAVDGLSAIMMQHIGEIQPKALCTLACTIVSRRATTTATDQVIEEAIARLDYFGPKDASLFVHALSKIRSVRLDAAWPHIMANLERSTWPGRDLALLCHVLSIARNDDVAYRVAALLPKSALGPVDIVHALALYSKMPKERVTEVVQFLLDKLVHSNAQTKLPLDGFAGLCKTLSRLGVLQDCVDLDRLKASRNAMGPSHLCVIGNSARTASCDTILELLAPRVVAAQLEFHEARHFAVGIMAYKKHPAAVEALVARLLSRQNAGSSRLEDFSTQEVVMLTNGSQACDDKEWWERLTNHIISRDWPSSELMQLCIFCSRSRHAKQVLDYVLANTTVDDLQLVDATVLLTCLWKVQVRDEALVRKIWSRVELLLSKMTTIDLFTFNGLLLSSRDHALPQRVLLGIAESVVGSRVDQWASVIGRADEALFRACLPSARSACASLDDAAREKLRDCLARMEFGPTREDMVLS